MAFHRNHSPTLFNLLNMNIREKIGNEIRILRLRKGWTPEELASKSGLRVGNIYSIEAGRYAVNVDVLQQLMDALGGCIRLADENGESV